MAIPPNIGLNGPYGYADGSAVAKQSGIRGKQVFDGMVHSTKGFVPPDVEVTMEDLNSDVFNASIETLVNLWVTRYGNNWVDIEDVMDDQFYGRVYKRLKALGELEVHFLTDRAKFVCRKPE